MPYTNPADETYLLYYPYVPYTNLADKAYNINPADETYHIGNAWGWLVLVTKPHREQNQCWGGVAVGRTENDS